MRRGTPSLGFLVAIAALALTSCGPTTLSPYDKRIRFTGRIDRHDPEGPRFAWSGSEFQLHFRGTAIEVQLKDLEKVPDVEKRVWPNRYAFFLDSEPPQNVSVPDSGQLAITLKDLGKGDHVLRVYKQTEALVGTGQLVGVELPEGGKLLDPLPAPKHRLELIGDSISAGYGLEGADRHCHYTPETQNHWRSFGPTLARALDAELVTIAWSGAGLMRHPEMTPLQFSLPELYDERLTPALKQPWAFDEYIPDAVVIALGQNDFLVRDPGEPALTKAMDAFFARVEAHYPKAPVFFLIGPMTWDGWPKDVHALSRLRKYAGEVFARRRAQGDTQLHLVEVPRKEEELPGCDYHPGIQTNVRTAHVLEEAIRSAWAAAQPRVTADSAH